MTPSFNHDELRNAVLAHYLAHATPATPAEVAAVLRADEEDIRQTFGRSDVQGVDMVQTEAGWGYEPSKELLRQNLARVLQMLDSARAEA